MNSIVVQIPLKISIELDPSSLTALQTADLSAQAVVDGLERVDIDPDYSNRLGYQSEFLGVEVTLPELSAEQRRNAARNAMAADGEDPVILKYHHFSLVMNRRRQLAYYTAVNIDGATAKKPTRAGDKWYFDPRIAESEQIGEDLYIRNALDRGHLVRRLDPAWGSDEEALLANDDTFHFSNCAPQHERFNQNSDTWQGIENYLLGQATGHKRRLSIFTGPVMTDEDPLYRGVRIPINFWKIAAYVDNNNNLVSSAFVLGQGELLDGLERFSPKTWQVKIAEVVKRTGLDFTYLEEAEVDFTNHAGLEATDGGLPRKPLGVVSDIVPL